MTSKLPKTQTAIALTTIGQPLTKITLPVPTPKEGQVLLKVLVAGCNPMDTFIRDSGPPPLLSNLSTLPLILAYDIVGTIHYLGPTTTLPSPLTINSKVFVQAASEQFNGGMQQYVLASVSRCIPLPENCSEIEGSTFPVNALTAGSALFGVNGLRIPLPGGENSKDFKYGEKKVAIFGAGTNVGKLEVQFLRNVGIGTIVVTASKEREEELKRLGATHFIDRKSSNVGKEIREIVGDELVYALDTFPSSNQDLQVSVLSNTKKGKLARVIPGKVMVSDEISGEKKEGFESTFAYGSSVGQEEFAVEFWRVFCGWVGEGKVVGPKMTVVEGLDEGSINGALDGLRGWKGEGKVTIRVFE